MVKIFKKAFLTAFICISFSVLKAQAFYSDTIDVMHYSIHLDMTQLIAKRIDGFAVLSLRPKIDNINSIKLDLLGLTVDSVKINNQPLSFVQHGEKLNINLQQAWTVGDTHDITIYYGGLPQQDASWGGFYFSNDGVYAFNMGVGFDANPHNYGRVWFPCIDDFKDKATYDFYINVNYGSMAVCGGAFINVNHNTDSTSTYHWHLADPIPTYLASVAVGKYALVNDVYNGIERNIPIEIYVRPQDTLKVQNTFINLKTALEAFENSFGPYKWQKVGYVSVPFNAGAMEHATNIAYPLFAINGNTTYDDLMAHELAHSWFGNLVTCSTAEDMWLNEGLASFAEFVFWEHMHGYDYAKSIIRASHKQIIQMAHIIDGDYWSVCGVPHNLTYSTTVYNKGALVAQNLRTYLGDSLFFDAIKAFMHNYAFDNISCVGFQDFLTNYLNRDMSDFFNAWVFEPGFAHFSVDSFTVNQLSQQLFEVDVFVKQKLNGRQNYADNNIVELSFFKEDWSFSSDTLSFSGTNGHKQFLLSYNPVSVFLNYKESFCHAATYNTKIVNQNGSSVFNDVHFTADVISVIDSAMVRVSHHWVAPDSIKNYNAVITRISDYRYWEVEGLDFHKFLAKGRFYYNRATPSNPSINSNTWLDNTLYQTDADSLLLLYRKSTKEDWQTVNFIRTGNHITGYLITDSLKLGQYTLGIGKPLNASSTFINSKNTDFQVLPNPSNGMFKIYFPVNFEGTMSIIDTYGKQVYVETITNATLFSEWQPNHVQSGIYYVVLLSEDKEKMVKKIIYTK